MTKRILTVLIALSMLTIIFTACTPKMTEPVEPPVIDTSSGSSKGLEFILNEDGESYTCISVGSCEYPEILIDKYNGLPVTAIGERAFYGKNNIIKVIIGDYVKVIGQSAFELCTSMMILELGEAVEIISDNTFNRCAKLAEVSFPESLVTIGNSAFWSCDELQEIIIPKNVKSIGSKAFYDCNKLEDLRIGKSLEIISEEAFKNCFFLSTITFSDKKFNLTSIEAGAFDTCAALSEIVYFGSEGEWLIEWSQVKISDKNDKLTNIEITFA